MTFYSSVSSGIGGGGMKTQNQKKQKSARQKNVKAEGILTDKWSFVR